jgi:hypothetical protein
MAVHTGAASHARIVETQNYTASLGISPDLR